jgi:cytochrome c oxidase subunit 2
LTTPGGKRRRGIAAAALLPPILLAGCGGGKDTQNTLAPHSHAAADITNLFWVMMAVSFGGLALVSGLLILSWFRRNRRGFRGADADDPHPSEHAAWWVVLGMGVVFPLAVVSALFIVGDGLIIHVTEAPAASRTSLTIRAIGHQWYWAFAYPGTKAVTADEMHMPVDTAVNLVATTDDVIHSFWVPELNRKIDTIPGQANRIELYANKAGIYRGQCAEFCGLQHAHMSMLVFVQSKAAFRKWLRNQAAPARAPTTSLARQGEKAFLDGACSSCHQIRGTSATGYVGPDLTHLASRTTLAGVMIRNTPSDLRRWIAHPQEVKPGNEMPDLRLSAAQLRALVAYLGGLK